jgi:hypothetical protein
MLGAFFHEELEVNVKLRARFIAEALTQEDNNAGCTIPAMVTT